MDKYTVDLDQVLNDFEYSELTDHYNTSRNSNNASSSSQNNNITKHSINNVFHSLNEYLNTNISVNNLNQIDNNLLENKENCIADINILKICQNNLKDEEKSIKDCNLKTDFIGNIQKSSESDNSADKDCNVHKNVDKEETCNEKTIESGSSRVNLEENVLETANGGEIKDDDCKENGVAPKEEEQIDNPIQKAEIEDDNVEETSKNDLKETNSPEKYEEVQENQTVGFVDDLNLDESELNKLLEELEEEEGLEETISQPVTVIVENDGCETVTETKDDQGEESNSALGASFVDNNEETHAEENLEHNLDNKEEIDKSGEAVTENISDLVAEDANKGVLVEEVRLENDIEAIEPIVSHGSQEKENIEPTNEKIVETEQQNVADPSPRPQNLPLNGKKKQPHRKINLIGDPGSTPYNNVYINKEIPRNKEKAYDSDTDYSTSSSPTFSDISTASTVSIDERNERRSKADITTGDSGNATGGSEINNCDDAPTNTNPNFEIENLTSGTENLASDPVLPTSEGVEVPEISVNVLSDDLQSSDSINIASEQAGASHVESTGDVSIDKQWLGKEAPLWIPDSDAMSCLHCDMKFTVLKRRHHCRACGLVLCSKCCHLRFRLEYLDAEARVCNKCHDILNKDTNSSSGSDLSPDMGNSPLHRPNPNNPAEYCSTVSPLQQVSSNLNPPAVMVPVGVLKRKGSNKGKSNKSVMFCDGIRPGSDLTILDNDFDYNNTKSSKKPEKSILAPAKPNKNLPCIDPDTNTFIPSSETALPPTVVVSKTDISYTECSNDPNTVELLQTEQLTFAIHVSLYVHLKIINMSCCINKMAWCFSTEGLINVGQDEIVILLEYINEESFVPKDVFYHISNVYNDAVKGTAVKEMGLSLHTSSNFLDSKNHAGFVYIRPTFQCLENVIKPKEPYLIGILIHRWETPWAKLFPLRLILRLGAEYRYYPSPIISTRHRDSIFVEIGHTIINLLADFRNFSYTLPQIRGLTIHMEDKNTTITIPINRYDQVMKSMNNSSDHILAFAGNFSQLADSHLVCIQDTQGNDNCYSTHAINIHNKPRKVTGASFIVFNGALKSSSGLTAKSNIVEDGLMIQVLPEHMQQIRESLRAMKNHVIPCGCVNAASDETVNIIWGENDINFNIGIVSAIDDMPLSGIPSIRVHNAKNHVCINGSRIIRWTEVFIIQNGDDNPKNQDPIDVSRISESIAKATCDALVKYLDLLVANSCQKIGIRTTLHVDNVSYLAGSNGSKLPPIYMKSLDNELIPVLHRITTNNLGENSIVLELIFRILNV